jgi:hypothetical protein
MDDATEQPVLHLLLGRQALVGEAAAPIAVDDEAGF